MWLCLKFLNAAKHVMDNSTLSSSNTNHFCCVHQTCKFLNVSWANFSHEIILLGVGDLQTPVPITIEMRSVTPCFK